MRGRLRRNAFGLIAAVALGLAGIAGPAAALSPADIPVEAFAALPSFSGVQMSPDGTRLAFFLELDGVKNAVIRPLDGNGGTLIPPEGSTSFHSMRWANNRHLLLQASATLDRLIFGTKTTETRWFRYDVETGEIKWLGDPGKGLRRASQFEQIVNMLPNDPDHILMQLDMETDGMSTVYRVKLSNGSRTVVRHQKRGIQRWFTDANAEVRLGNGFRNNVWTTIVKDANDDWINLTKTDWSNDFDIVGFTNDPGRVLVAGQKTTDRKALYELELSSGAVTEAVFAHPEVDIGYPFYDPNTGQLQGVVYTDDFTRRHYFDKDLARIQRGLDKALPDTVNTVLQHIPSKDWYFVLAQSDTNPGRYFIYDRPNRRLNFVAAQRPEIDPALMAATEAVSIPVRGGSEIPGYLTKPQGKTLKQLPTIILPHGGPTGVRDTAHWDHEAQFYASRGWLVLKPNFRGSGGYGERFRSMGKNQWGGLMQDDVTDATKWLIDAGYADPDRICIVGSSYGGYAALMGTIKEPGLYRCAVSLNGAANLIELKRGDRRNKVGGRSLTKNMGLKGAEDEDVSPYHRAADVSAPVLLMAAEDDARVPWTHSRNMHRRLKKLGKSSRFVKIEEGTHYMLTAQSRLIALKAAEAFLKEHLDK